MKEFLEYLYKIGVRVEVFDAIYNATKKAAPSEYRKEIIEWYKANIGDD